LDLAFLKKALFETGKITSMMLFILICAQIFGRLISLIKLPAAIIATLDPILDKTFLILILLMVFYFLLGMFLESVAGMIMAIPVTLPIMDVVGIDPLWFGVMVGMLLCIGLVTPPIGMAVFSASGVSGAPLSKLFSYNMVWALIGFIIVGGLMIFFPEIATWLPSHMKS
jgi:C4-dicarboxylate transporter DctM subunit